MDRPVFNSILERIRSGNSGGLVVYRTDRFSRSLLGALNTLADIGEHNAKFVSVTEPQLDYSTTSGQALLHMLFVFAEMMRSGLKDSWAISARNAIERGVHISPSDYLGYDRDANGRLVPNADAPTRSSRSSVAADTANRGARSPSTWTARHPRPKGVWTGQAVQRLCAKRVYVGEASRYVGQDRRRARADHQPRRAPRARDRAGVAGRADEPTVRGGRQEGRAASTSSPGSCDAADAATRSPPAAGRRASGSTAAAASTPAASASRRPPSWPMRSTHTSRRSCSRRSTV